MEGNVCENMLGGSKDEGAIRILLPNIGDTAGRALEVRCMLVHTLHILLVGSLLAVRRIPSMRATCMPRAQVAQVAAEMMIARQDTCTQPHQRTHPHTQPYDRCLKGEIQVWQNRRITKQKNTKPRNYICLEPGHPLTNHTQTYAST